MINNNENAFDKYLSLAGKFPTLLENSNELLKIIIDKPVLQEWQAKRRQQLNSTTNEVDGTTIGLVFDDPYVVIFRDLVEFPGGFRNGYIRLYNRAYLEGGAAGVVMLPEMDGKLLLMHQFRHATRSWHWEVPRGFGEPGVQAEDQARVEIEEEISGEIAELTNLGLYFNNTGLEGNPIYLFLAKMSSVGEPKLKFGVDKFIWVSVSELEQMIADGEITDGFTIAAYTKARLKKLI